MQSKVWFIIVATVCVVTFAIAQEESSESPATVTTGSISDSIEQSAQDNIARDSYSAKSDEEIANELRNRAKDALLTQAIASEEDLSSANIADDLLNMEGMDDSLALALAKKEILNMEELAEQSIDELMDIDNMDEERAGKLIMTARAPWFEE